MDPSILPSDASCSPRIEALDCASSRSGGMLLIFRLRSPIERAVSEVLRAARSITVPTSSETPDSGSSELDRGSDHKGSSDPDDSS